MKRIVEFIVWFDPETNQAETSIQFSCGDDFYAVKATVERMNKFISMQPDYHMFNHKIGAKVYLLMSSVVTQLEFPARKQKH